MEKINNLCYNLPIKEKDNNNKSNINAPKEKSFEKITSVSKINLKNIKPLIDLNETKEMEKGLLKENTASRNMVLNTTRISGPISTKSSSTLLTINDEGKQKVASICNQIKLNSTKNFKKKSTKKLVYINPTKNILNTMSSIGTSNNVNGAIVNKRKSLIIETDQPTIDTANNYNLTARNEPKKISLHIGSIEEKKQKYGKHGPLNNIPSNNLSGNVLDPKKVNKFEKKKNKNLSDYQAINQLVGGVKRVTINAPKPVTKPINLDLQKIGGLSKNK